MNWKDILKNAITTTSLANIQVDDDYSDLEEEYNEDCKKRLRAFLEKIEGELKFLLVKINPIIEKYGKKVYRLGDPDNYYVGQRGEKLRRDYTIRMQEFDRTLFDKLSEEFCCDMINAIKESHKIQSEFFNQRDSDGINFVARVNTKNNSSFLERGRNEIKETIVISEVKNTASYLANEDLEFDYAVYKKWRDPPAEIEGEYREYYLGISEMVKAMNKKIDSLITSL